MLHKRIFPPLGQRIIKTAAAVFLIEIFYMLQGNHGSPATSAVAAIICMQPYAEDSKTFALDRVFGTVLGAFWGLSFLLLMKSAPILSRFLPVAYGFIGLFVILAIYSTVLIKKSALASLAAIVFVSTVGAYPNVSSPLTQVLHNLADTIVGTLMAVVVNVSHLPRQRQPQYLFFVRTQDLVPDRFQQIPSSVHIALDMLFRDGAKICLVSRWAPAFIISQMGLMNVNAPVIIMDGAALYDIRENRYLDVIQIPMENADRLRKILAGFGAGCNIYTVNERSMSIFRDGPMNDAENRQFESMRRSPYRNYLDGMYHEEDWIASIRVLDTSERIEELAYQVRSVLPTGMFRMEIRQEARMPGVAGLHFYDIHATQEEMKHRVKAVMEAQHGELQAVDMLPRTSHYRPEHDALLLLNRLKNKYEPVRLLTRRK